MCADSIVGPISEPDPFLDSFTGLVAARALSTATLLGVFDALREAPAGPAELAERLSLDPLGAETLLTTLLTLGYVEPAADGRLANSPVSERLLVSSSPESIATFVGAQGDLHWQVLALLPEAVRDGTAYAMHEQRRDDAARWEAYIRGLFEISRPEHEANAVLVPVEDPRRLVDVAGGHGGFSMAMCRRHPELEATVLDLPPSAAVGRQIVAEQGFAERVSFREGDVFELGLGEGRARGAGLGPDRSDSIRARGAGLGPDRSDSIRARGAGLGPDRSDSMLDVVSVFNLIHHLPEERDRELCRMARAALRPGGCLVVGDSARPEPGEQVSEHGAVSSLLFYAWSHSRNFKPSEVRAWMEDAGFAEVEVHRNERSPWRVVVVGR